MRPQTRMLVLLSWPTAAGLRALLVTCPPPHTTCSAGPPHLDFWNQRDEPRRCSAGMMFAATFSRTPLPQKGFLRRKAPSSQPAQRKKIFSSAREAHFACKSTGGRLTWKTALEYDPAARRRGQASTTCRLHAICERLAAAKVVVMQRAGCAGTGLAAHRERRLGHHPYMKRRIIEAETTVTSPQREQRASARDRPQTSPKYRMRVAPAPPRSGGLWYGLPWL